MTPDSPQTDPNIHSLEREGQSEGKENEGDAK